MLLHVTSATSSLDSTTIQITLTTTTLFRQVSKMDVQFLSVKCRNVQAGQNEHYQKDDALLDCCSKTPDKRYRLP